MTDVTQEIERLAQLRAAGMITSLEFEQEKKRLLNEAANEAYPQFSIMVRIFAGLGLLTLFCLIFAIIGWLQEARALQDKEPGTIASAQAVQQEWNEAVAEFDDAVQQAESGLTELAGGITDLRTTGWTIASKIDPMSDLQVTTATARLAAAPFLVEVTVTCTGDQSLIYQFATYTYSGQAANFRRDYDSKGNEQASFTVRVDSSPAFKMVDGDLPNGNVVRLISLVNFDELIFAERAAQGTHLAVRFPLERGNPVLEIDQGEPALRNMLGGCLRQMAASRKRAGMQRSSISLRNITATAFI